MPGRFSVAVKEIVDAGIGLQIDTVGFGVDDTARGQLACIAEVGGGTYYDAEDASGLTSSLTKLTTRTARPFMVLGTPVEGTPTPDDAPVIGPGQYVDSLSTSSQGQVEKHYRIQRTQPNSTLKVSMVGRLPHYAGTFPQGVQVRWELSAPRGHRVR